MTHTVRDKARLLARVRRIRGQVEAVERALDAEVGCARIMHLLASTRAALTGLTAEVIEEHVRTHLVDATKHPEALDPNATDDLVGVIRTYLK